MSNLKLDIIIPQADPFATDDVEEISMHSVWANFGFIC